MSSATFHLLVHDGVVLNLADAADLHDALTRWCAALERLAAVGSDTPSASLLAGVAADVTHLLSAFPSASEGGRA